MEKIPTIFDRDWDGNRGVVDRLVVDEDFHTGVATEKLDGTNVRLTVRNETLVRLEKRRNPDKAQKAAGITEPWYVDASVDDPADKWIWDAARNTGLADVPDGEWSGEAIGSNIQGNPLGILARVVVLFSLPAVRWALTLPAPHTYDELRTWLSEQRSTVNGDAPIEGVVWHAADGRMFKIKRADFK